MSATRQRGYRRLTSTAVAIVGVGALLAGCTGNTPESSGGGGGANNASSNNDKSGDKVTIGFSAPAADHGWMAGITNAAKAAAENYEDVDLVVAEGTNDVSAQISQVETFINDKVDAIVLLPFDGAALTPVAQKAMDAGIPVINVDRQFDSPFAARATILGDNYGMGVSAGTYICSQLGGKPNSVVAEIAGIDSLPLTQDRSRGFADALWNHDDDQGIGVLAAINQANRSEFIMVGGAGSKAAIDAIAADNSVLKATVTYSPSMASSAISLARLIGQNKGMSDLVELQVPKEITLASETITKDNAAKYAKTGF